MHFVLLFVPAHRYCVVGVEVLAFVTLIGVTKDCSAESKRMSRILFTNNALCEGSLDLSG